MRLGQTSAIYTISKIVGSVLGFLATVYFANELGDAVLGQFALVLALVTWGSVVATAGLGRSLTKRMSERTEPGRYFGAGLLVAAAIGLVAVVVVLLASDLVGRYVGASVASLVALLLVVRLFDGVVIAALKGDHLVHVNSVLRVGERTVRSLAQVGLVVVGWRLAGMIVGLALSTLLVVTAGVWYLDVRPALPRRHHLTSLYEFARFAWIGDISQQFYRTLDITVLGFFVASGLVGVYSVVWSLVMFLAIFGTGVRETLFPEMSKLSAADESGSVAGLTEEALVFSGMILVPGLVGGILLDDRLLRIYGPSFVEGTRVFGLLAAAALVWTYNRQLQNTLNAIDRPGLAAKSNAIFLGANVVLNLALVPAFGIVGAAAATLVSAGVGLVVSVRYVRAVVEFQTPIREIANQWIAALLMGGVVYALRAVGDRRWFVDLNAVFIVLLAGIGAGVYFGLLLGISPRVRTTVVRNVPFIPERVYR